jgi:hypothetical protein
MVQQGLTPTPLLRDNLRRKLSPPAIYWGGRLLTIGVVAFLCLYVNVLWHTGNTDVEIPVMLTNFQYLAFTDW